VSWFVVHASHENMMAAEVMLEIEGADILIGKVVGVLTVLVAEYAPYPLIFLALNL